MEEMAFKYHPVSTRFWRDEKREIWTDDATLLALYLLTCPHRTSEGLFRLPKRYIEADLKWSPKRLAEPFAQLSRDGLIDYDEGVSVMLLRNALKYQQPANPNQETAALRAIEELPQTLLLQEFQLLAERFAKRFAKRLAERYAQSPTLSLTLTPTQTLDSPADKQRSKREFSDDAHTLAKTLYEWLKSQNALPAQKGWYVRQVGIAENQLLKAHTLVEWLDCFEWVKGDAFWSPRLTKLADLGGTIWSQYSRRSKTEPAKTPSATPSYGVTSQDLLDQLERFSARSGQS